MLYLSEYKLKGWAIIASIIFALFIEYYMIVMQTYQNFQSAWGNWGGFIVYLLVTIFSIVFLRFVFKRINGARFIKTFVYAMLIVIPIGFFWGWFQGYAIGGELLNIDWQFTHDMVYTVLVSQFVVLAILLFGTKALEDEQYDDFKPLKKTDWQKEDSDYFDTGF